MDVLVTGADQRQGLSVIRSLGRNGVSVVAAGSSDDSLGFYSKYAKAKWVYPHPYDRTEEFIDSLIEAITKYQVRLVIPVVESTLTILNEHRETIDAHAPLATASRDAVELCLDKARQLRLAVQHGIPVPRFVTPSSMEEAEELIPSLKFPVVLKSGSRPAGIEDPQNIFKVSFVGSWDSLKDYLKVYYRNGVLPIVQELCVGRGVACGIIMEGREPLYCYQYHRGREFPPTGGVPVRYESMPIWEKLRDYSIRMLQAMKWNGVAQVEWKNIPGTQEVQLMEVNGRFWASLPGAIHAGMDFPYWHYTLWNRNAGASSGDLNKPYRAGVGSRYLRADLQRLELLLRENIGLSSVLPVSKSREILRFLVDFIDWRVKSDTFAWDDLHPGLHETRDVLGQYVGRFTQRFRRRRS